MDQNSWFEVRIIDIWEVIFRPGYKNLNIVFIVLEKEREAVQTSAGFITRYLVADTSGSVSLSVWDDRGNHLAPGHIMHLKGGHVLQLECLTT